ncbi:amino acid ABC transporter permease [Brevibacillus daliensis]|uniref:amino acid ABC transporter permease n=1 Tax=Brevibacillus daliensis TaxID=2892995 RepID=UPI001E59778E|nr:amino acid ABC transporter permease [Brevibacillus daliensis]
MTSSLQVIRDALPILAEGSLITLQITLISISIAFFIGLVFGLLSVSKMAILRWIAACYVTFIRGTPLLVQIFFIYFGIPQGFDIKIPAITAAIIAVSINAGAYMAEIFRAGIQSIDAGQMEAGRSLGMTMLQTMRFIILPQALRRMLPAFVNQIIVSLKDTSLVSVIGIRDLTNTGEIIISNNFRSMEIWGAVAVFYFIIIYFITLCVRYLEKRSLPT